MSNQTQTYSSVSPIQLLDFLTRCLDYINPRTGVRPPILIKGPPGVGKTDVNYQAVKKYCNTHGEGAADIIVCHPVVDEPIDYKGLPWIGKDGDADFKPIGQLRKFLTAEVPTLVVFDDLGQAPQSTQAAAMQLVLNREINGLKISDEIMFTACTNRKEDQAGVGGLIEPLKSRFATILELYVTTDDWLVWARHHGMPTELIAYLTWKPSELMQFEPTPDIVNTATPRTVASVGDLVNMGLPREISRPVIYGAAGEGFGVQFMEFMEVMNEIPTAQYCLENPEEVGIPTREDLRWAMCASVSESVTKKYMKNFLILLNRMPQEYSVAAMQMATTRDVKLRQTSTFGQWIKENTLVLVNPFAS